MELGGRIKEQLSISLTEALHKASSVLADLHKVRGFVSALDSLSVNSGLDIIRDAELTVKSIREETASLLQTIYLTEIALSSVQEVSSNDLEEPIPKKSKVAVAIADCEHCGKKFACSSNEQICRSCKPTTSGDDSVLRKVSRGSSVQCTQCDTSFVYKRCLAKHMKEHHSLSDQDHMTESHHSIVQQVMEQMTSEPLTESHDIITESHDLLSETQESLSDSHDILPESHDSLKESVYESIIEDGKCGVALINGVDKRYHCLLCDKVFNRPYRIQRHLQVHNPSRAKVQCHICSKQFTRIDTLQTHLRAVHTDEKPFNCTFPDCERRFAVQSALVHHLKTHMDGKPYKCPECPQTFALISQFKNHLSTLHQDTKDLRCTACFKLFPDSQQLLTHRYKEHRLECEICNKSFAKLGFLQSHVDIHNGPSLFNCRLCNAGFDNEFSYKQHTKTHPKHSKTRSNNPCTVCGESFVNGKQLMEHYQSPNHKDKANNLTTSLPLASHIEYSSLEDSHASLVVNHAPVATPTLDKDTSQVIIVTDPMNY